LNLAGPFQHENAALAIAALENLRTLGLSIDDSQIRRGLREVYWPGRFEIVERSPTVILDCAHNELAIQALLETMELEIGAGVRPRLIFGCLEDKRWDRMAAMLAPRVSSAILTRVKPKRPLDPIHLLPLFAPYSHARIITDPVAAVETAIAEAAADEVILVTGSVYLVGEVYPWFMARAGRRGLFPETAA
jgi:dihydrofolate synthase/folylpolyglutamate synthase